MRFLPPCHLLRTSVPDTANAADASKRYIQLTFNPAILVAFRAQPLATLLQPALAI